MNDGPGEDHSGQTGAEEDIALPGFAPAASPDVPAAPAASPSAASASPSAASASPSSASPAGSYLVLARKYRPSGFEDLIGQEPLVRTLTNAFELNRIHQAYLLTGVRGVGKTTTARILARAFNYELPAKDGHPAIDQPTIDMKEPGVHCQAIIESRHVDVIEMDAASHTGVGDVREIIESVRYRPVLARTKVYIIDEVHMLTNQAFNALLKTLEEPPEHVRFIFATTESEKIPVTVRSRCQRFDLRRVDSGLIMQHLAGICEKEGVIIEQAALALIARAAEGSVRDSLSLLDQAIAHSVAGEGGRAAITAEGVLRMLGAGARGRIVDLFEAAMNGRTAEALTIFKTEYDRGADPLLLLTDLAEFVHFVTRLKVAPGTASDVAISEEERTRGETFAKGLSLQTLTLAWQIVSKGIGDVKDSPRPLAAGDMVLVRLCHASGLPSPEDIVRRLASMPAGEGAAPRTPSGGGGGASMQAAAPAQAYAPASAPSSAPRAHLAVAPRSGAAAAPAAAGRPRVQLRAFEDVVALAQMRRDIQLKIALERDARLVQFEHGRIVFEPGPGASPGLAQQLARRLEEWTGERWTVSLAGNGGAPSLKEQQDAQAREKIVGVRSDPLVKAVLDRFPGAQIVEVRNTREMAAGIPADAPAEDADGERPGEDIAFDNQTGIDGDDDELDF
ncbi:MAG: DNA polymerase III subunit gamma/tau [Beijerinckiaceae bacterium]